MYDQTIYLSFFYRHVLCLTCIDINMKFLWRYEDINMYIIYRQIPNNQVR